MPRWPRPTEQTKSSLKRLLCISKVSLRQFVLGEYYTEMEVADLPIRRSCLSKTDISINLYDPSV